MIRLSIIAEWEKEAEEVAQIKEEQQKIREQQKAEDAKRRGLR